MAVVVNFKQIGILEAVAKNTHFKTKAIPKETYKLIDTETGKSPKNMIVKRDGDTLVMWSPDDNVRVDLEAFWSACSIGEMQCFVDIDVLNKLGTSSVVQVTQSDNYLTSLETASVGSLSTETSLSASTHTAPVMASDSLTVVNFAVSALGLAGVGVLLNKEEERSVETAQVTTKTSNASLVDTSEQLIAVPFSGKTDVSHAGDMVKISVKDSANQVVELFTTVTEDGSYMQFADISALKAGTVTVTTQFIDVSTFNSNLTHSWNDVSVIDQFNFNFSAQSGQEFNWQMLAQSNQSIL